MQPNGPASLFAPAILLPFATTVTTAGLCFLARPIANRLRLFDYPRGGRKSHLNPTPQTGGIAILVSLMGWLWLERILGATEPLYLALLLCGTGVGLMGVLDDQLHLSAVGRLMMLAIFTVIAFALDPQLTVPAIPWGIFSWMPVSAPLFIVAAIVATAGFVSSVNMADGIDGLVPAALLIWCIGFDVFSDGAVRQVAWVLTGPAAVLLVFNLRGAVFLGDCGTFGLGFVIAMLAIASLRSGKPHPETLLVWFFVPVLDCLRVVTARLLKGHSPFRGGKDHFHHILADVFGARRGFYVYTTTILATSAAAALVPGSCLYILVGLTASCLGFIAARRVIEQRQRLGTSAAISSSRLRAAGLKRGLTRKTG